MEEYISECCFAYPAGELDMSTVKYGGPSGFCGRCLDNCIFLPAMECSQCLGDGFVINEEMYPDVVCMECPQCNGECYAINLKVS